MGNFHPRHRADFRHYIKSRRNSRILEKFYDSRIIDIRTGDDKFELLLDAMSASQ